MKYAVISDIHGDILALEEALKLIEKENVDKIICLGDSIGIGPYPEQCVQKLMSLGDKLINVRGNHEDRYLFGYPEFVHDDKRRFTEEEKMHGEWVKSQLSEESKDYLIKLPQTVIIKDGNIKIAIMHYPTDVDNVYRKFIFFPTKEEALDLFGRYEADVNLFGHTHMAHSACRDNKWHINPGSLGLPEYRDYGTYGILNVENDEVSYLECAFKYDYNQVLKEMFELDYPEVEKMRSLFFGKKIIK